MFFKSIYKDTGFLVLHLTQKTTVLSGLMCAASSTAIDLIQTRIMEVSDFCNLDAHFFHD